SLADTVLERDLKKDWTYQERTNWLTKNLDEIISKLKNPNKPDVGGEVAGMAKIMKSMLE
ncbi:MAG: hypothetical protein AAFY56_13415, partial [Pseudomonadota bacterium]